MLHTDVSNLLAPLHWQPQQPWRQRVLYRPFSSSSQSQSHGTTASCCVLCGVLIGGCLLEVDAVMRLGAF
jgi:hypothetical protein